MSPDSTTPGSIPVRTRHPGTVPVDGGWLQEQLDLRLLTITSFAREVPCDSATLRKALAGGPISVRRAADIVQALKRLPVSDSELVAGLVGSQQSQRATA